ncbi:Gp15 family bacteriophage protein [Leuconostoc pseudomesenteroides]|uniref:Gp15 family bacteriophage protein n=1 Tax=Leuconostoc pseudomesenteroides TaxID=33968 RepID=UPI00403DDB54
MLKLNDPLADTVIINDERYTANLMFDNVMTLFEMMRDDEISEETRLSGAFILLFGRDFELEVDKKISLFDDVFQQLINPDIDENDLYDELGERLPSIAGSSEKTYDLFQDADAIYSSFMKDYGIDLIESRGKLHWYKFNALLNGLSEDTALMNIIQIRTWKPDKNDSSEHKAEMRKLQEQYKLK